MILKFTMKMIVLALTHLIAGRLFSLPLSITLFGKWYIAALVIVGMDLLLIPIYFYFYESPAKLKFITSRIRLMRMRRELKLKKRGIIREERNIHAKLLKKARSFGQWGVFFLPSVPFLGGGLWSSILLAHLLKLERKRSYLLVAGGSFFGCSVLALGFGGVKALFLFFITMLRTMMS
ncbi:MAG: small multi-drug export protein [bacterium]